MVDFRTLIAISTMRISQLPACLLSFGATMLPAIAWAAPQPATFGFDDAPGIQGCGGVALSPLAKISMAATVAYVF